MTNNVLTVFCDGGSRGNPGPSASAFVVYDADGALAAEGKGRIGVATNNTAEYRAVIMALTWLTKNQTGIATHTERIEIVLDSQLLVRQLAGQYRVKSEHLQELFGVAKKLERKLALPVTYTHVLREKNPRADALVNQALDEPV